MPVERKSTKSMIMITHPKEVFMQKLPGNFQKTIVLMLALLALTSSKVQAATTVTVDDNKVTVTQPLTPVPVTATPVVFTQANAGGDFEGRISEVNYAQNWILLRDTSGRDRQVLVKQE